MRNYSHICIKLLLFVLLFFISSCGEMSLVGFDLKAEQKQGPAVIQKSYSRPPLTRSELADLIDMTVYSGPAERYGEMLLDEQSEQYGSLPVSFSHRTHRSRYTCNVCHIELEFSLKRGESGISREDYLEGRFCGACHDGKLAFSTEFACDACHQESGSKPLATIPTTEKPPEQQLPAVQYGDQIDWVEALHQSAIAPQRSLYDDTRYPSMPLPDHLQKPLLWTTATPNLLVRFPHREHVEWLDCSSCHPDLFSIKQTGTVEFTKESNLYGQFCGTCHMNVALPMNGCSRCHPRVKDHR